MRVDRKTELDEESIGRLMREMQEKRRHWRLPEYTHRGKAACACAMRCYLHSPEYQQERRENPDFVPCLGGPCQGLPEA